MAESDKITETDLDLWQAVWDGDVSMLRVLVDDEGANVNSMDGFSPLHFACRWGHTPMVECLLEFGANVDILDENLQTPLHWAVSGGDLPEIQCLVNERGTGYVESRDSWRQYQDVIEILLENKSSPDSRDNIGKTALHIAAEKNDLPLIELLLKHNAQVNALDGEGRTPLQYANEDKTMRCLEDAESEVVKQALSSAHIKVQEGSLLGQAEEEAALREKITKLESENVEYVNSILEFKKSVQNLEEIISKKNAELENLHAKMEEEGLKHERMEKEMEKDKKELLHKLESLQHTESEDKNPKEDETTKLRNELNDLRKSKDEVDVALAEALKKVEEMSSKLENNEKNTEKHKVIANAAQQDINRLKQERERRLSGQFPPMKADELPLGGTEENPIYPLERLKTNPPITCNRTRLEDYLSDEEFVASFKMDREAYIKIPQWKKNMLKKQLGIY